MPGSGIQPRCAGLSVLPSFRLSAQLHAVPHRSGSVAVHLPVPLPWLLPYADIAVLLMRLLVGAVFITSGLSHARDPVTRGKSIGQSPGFTRFLGIAEIAGGLGVAVGVLAQIAALGLILIMLGAIQKK